MSDNEIIFSVIVPTYNRAELLGQTIDSVLAQEFNGFEVVIIDDGSTDNTFQVVDSFKNKRITYYKKENGERGAARNFGIGKAKGEYVTFLDSDDLLRKNCLSTAWSYIQQDRLDIFHLGYDVVGPDKTVLIKWKRLPSPVNDKLIEGNFLSCLGLFAKKEIIGQYLFNEDRNLAGSEDYELWLRLAARFPIYTFPDSTAMLVNHETRSVVNVDVITLSKRIELLWYYLMKDEYFVKRYKNVLKRFDAFRKIYLALHLSLLPHEKALSAEYAMQAVFKFPPLLFNKRFWVIIKKLILRE